MKSTIENLSPTRVRLAVEVPFDELEPGLKAAYKKIGQQIRVPGFRPGKVPARVIDQRVGRGAVLQEAINEALPGVYGDAARENEVMPVGQPDIEITNIADNESISFTAEVDVRPEITLPELDGIEVTVADATVADADIEEQLDSLRERFATLSGVERPVEDGDFVSLDLAASVDGEPVEDGSAKGLSYEVGKGDLLDGLDEAITGTAAGEQASFTTTLRHGEHADAEAEVTATVNSIKVKDLPAADDEFAQLASEFDTIDELRDDLRERLGRAKLMAQGSEARDKLLEKIVSLVDFPLPESAVTAEVDYREHDVLHSLNHDDAMFDRLLEAQGKTREEFTAELREGAEQSVRAQFILDKVAEAGDVQVDNAELTEYLVNQAARYGMAPKQFADQIVQSGNLTAMVADVRRNKALANVLENAVVSDSSGNRVDLQALGELLREADAAEGAGEPDEVDDAADDA